MLKIAVIIGSTRPGRVGESVAKWAFELTKKRTEAEFELVDIKDFDLPLLDEPVPPSMGQYSKQHTKIWAAKIDSFDGYVFVTPEYNHGICGAAKNRVSQIGPAPCRPLSYGTISCSFQTGPKQHDEDNMPELPEGFTPASWDSLKEGDIVWTNGRQRGKPDAFGPYTVVNLERRVLQNEKGMSVTHYPDDLIVKEVASPPTS